VALEGARNVGLHEQVVTNSSHESKANKHLSTSEITGPALYHTVRTVTSGLYQRLLCKMHLICAFPIGISVHCHDMMARPNDSSMRGDGSSE
jgi:hypothetical protein